ncbi:uncharacterized protein CLBA1-like [Perognathus longimembris pacificus]|uniref:uncharacterized protein CLBA1 n=1 Tax=Perognathus longimembris pacificus TaxID=214514 RepID=UPI002019FABA|nr:uncharacterized protein CLBA1 [Perognathus longimembris pacificus]XP_048218626.1 uncharacterized protein CLBA1-like [Perognathus longimembris pacificus]
MQGRRELGAEAVSDLAGGPGTASLRRAAGGQSGDGVRGTRTCCPSSPPAEKAGSSRPGAGLRARSPSCPDPGEPSSGWGEFEGFQESSARAEQFALALELLERPTEPQPPRTPSIPKEPSSHQLHPGGPWAAGSAACPSSEPILSYENVFKSVFQEVPVEQATEDVSTLDHFLGTNSEENPGLTSVHRPCCDSRRLWRALQSSSAVSASPGPWQGSRCRQRLLLLLGVDTAQSLSGGQDHVLEGSGLREPEELLAVSTFQLQHCKALIQTKLAGAAGSRRGSLITYGVFLKTPLRRDEHYITVPQKIFSPRNLKMAFFNRDVW